MPFSIKRLAQLHRSHSLPQGKESPKPGDEQNHQSSKSSSKAKKSKHKEGSRDSSTVQLNHPPGGHHPHHQSVAPMRSVPPSFVICSQAPLNSNPGSVSSSQLYNVPIPNSRSLDSTEIRRLANQSSKFTSRHCMMPLLLDNLDKHCCVLGYVKSNVERVFWQTIHRQKVPLVVWKLTCHFVLVTSYVLPTCQC